MFSDEFDFSVIKTHNELHRLQVYTPANEKKQKNWHVIQRKKILKINKSVQNFQNLQYLSSQLGIVCSNEMSRDLSKPVFPVFLPGLTQTGLYSH